MAKIWIQGKERFMCPACKNEEIDLGQKYCQICGESLEWEVMMPYWTLKKYEDTGLTPEEIKALNANRKTSEHRWIPVEERLPEEEGKYLVTFAIDEKVRLVGYGCCQKDILGNNIGFGWYDLYRGIYFSGKAFIAWQPLPEPYRPEE